MRHARGGTLLDRDGGNLATTGSVDVGALYVAHRSSLVRLATMLVGDLATGEDVVQDVFVRLHRGRERLVEPDAMVGYLRTAVVNQARSVLRRRKSAINHAPSDEPESAPGADASLLLSEEHRQVVRLVQQLPPAQREVVVLRYWLRMSEAEIADTLGISRGTVKSQASRALDKIESMLGGASS